MWLMKGQVYGVPALGRSDVCPKAQIGGPKPPSSHVLPQYAPILYPWRQRYQEVAKGSLCRLLASLRPESSYLACGLLLILLAIRRQIRASSGQFLHLQQGGRSSACSHHLWKRYLLATEVPCHVSSKLLFVKKLDARAGKFQNATFLVRANSGLSSSRTSLASNTRLSRSALGSVIVRACYSVSGLGSSCSSRFRCWVSSFMVLLRRRQHI